MTACCRSISARRPPQGIDLNFISDRRIRARPSTAWPGHQEFDAAEFSSSEFISRRGANDCPFVAIPVFPSRMFRHSFITVNTQDGETPKDLAGKRIGVPLYTMSAAVWIRGLLPNDYGVDFSKVHWVQGAPTKPGGMAIRRCRRSSSRSRSRSTPAANR